MGSSLDLWNMSRGCIPSGQGSNCTCRRLTPGLPQRMTRHVAFAIHSRTQNAGGDVPDASSIHCLPLRCQHQNRRRLPLFAPADRHNGLFLFLFESASDMGRNMIGCAPSHLPQTAICPKKEQSETAPSGPWFWLAGEIQPSSVLPYLR